MVYGCFWSKVYLATTIGLSILLKSFLSKHFLLWAEPRNDVEVGTQRECGYCIHCGKDLVCSSNKDEVSSNSSLGALQRLTHHLKGFILFSMSPLAAAAAAQINDSEGSDGFFTNKLN